ncbi:MAG TPA: AMP-binding protein, partial [Blastocatellia bacterium]
MKINTLSDLLQWRSETRPDEVGYIFLADGEDEELRLTYGELERKARIISQRLRDIASKGERVLLLYPPGLDFIAAFFGCIYAGVVAVPVYPPRRNRNLLRLQAIVADADAKAALTTSIIVKRVEPQCAEDPYLRQVCWMATDEIPFDSLSDDAGWRAEVEEDSIAFLQYTSGSTGDPKGVVLQHKHLLHNAAVVYTGCDHRETDRYVTWLPTFHDMGFMAGLLQPLYGGFPVISMPPAAFLQRPYLWLKAISKYQATTSGGPNFAYDLCIRKITAEQSRTLDLRSWEVAFNGAEPIHSETLRNFADKFAECGFRYESFFPCYGLAEATLMATGSHRYSSPEIQNLAASWLERGRVTIASDAAE